MSIWDRNGWVTVEVTQECIDEALERDSSHCAVALAIARAFPVARRIAVDLQTCRWSMKGKNGKSLSYVFLTPHNAQDNIIAVDVGEREKIVPFTLRMRPCQISRAGKNRRECPDNSELRGTGLTVNEDQPHLDAEDPDQQGGDIPKQNITPNAKKDSAPQRLNADGTRNCDPNRRDGLIEPPQKRGRPRRKVSTAHKGSIPTTLGGRLPPVSILSRREYGLRLLKR